ncbi:MAG: Asp-tRNA(Asn)/Glu-tRNA(Gln) amidotransferase subunit GatA [Planctomycetota bacterium]|nr:Asp-tRNA(Asn)/Glu-tRNA(Gln) amidotransferase subunit GatA [Planctomycetota bacterium]
MSEPSFETCVEIRDAIRSGRRTAVSVIEETLQRIECLNERTNAFRDRFDEEAMASAHRIDQEVANGRDPGPLAGVPVGIKDNITTTEGTVTCGSRMLDGYRSPFDATVVDRLRAAGAIPVGHTNCDEFAMGSSTETCFHGPVRNPWDPSRVPGGSSGGSAAAVSAGMVPLSLGSDTGGSIRQPAALCGCVGLKPSYGRVSRYGLVAFGSSLDQIGPFTRSVEDASLVMQVISGQDPRDSTSVDQVFTPCDHRERGFEGLRVGIPRQYRVPGTNEPAVEERILQITNLIAEQGAQIIDVDLPLTDKGISTYYVIAPAEASSNLARFDGIRYGHRTERKTATVDELLSTSRAEGFGPEVQRRIMLGTYVLSSGYYDAYYNRALQARRLIKEEFDRAFESCDVLLGPTSPTTAFEIGSKLDPISMYMCDIYTVNNNMAGICGISIPAGLAEGGSRGLPIGLQLQAKTFNDAELLEIARLIESELGFDYSSVAE